MMAVQLNGGKKKTPPCLARQVAQPAPVQRPDRRQQEHDSGGPGLLGFDRLHSRSAF